jgi:hypothetical protein
MKQATGTGWIDQLGAAIEAIDRPGDFCTTGLAPAVLPGLEVPGLGPIGLPLSPDRAEQLKRLCEQAAYGKGERTVVDTNVRRVWRLTPDRFALANPAWDGAVRQMVATVQHALGLDKQPLQHHLYDLLLYEPGGFFLPHRDGEKLDRMVATLIVMLPSHFTGGQLIVRHEGQERVIDLGGEGSRFLTQFAAFYADCEHEVKPVTAGHRLCLVYNLTLAKAKRPVGAPPRDRHVRQVADVLGRWTSADGAPRKLAVTLEHQYTQDGLAWDALKGIDRARATVLAEAAAAAGCHAHLALVTLWEVGSSEGDGYDDYHSHGWDDEAEEDGDESGTDGDYEMGELIDSSLSADQWQAPDGTAMPFGPLPIGEGEVWPAGSLQAVKPEEAFEGYTGNAGMTLERWYRRAAIVLWPDDRHFEVLCDAGAKQAVPALLQLTAAARRADGEAAATLRERCRRFARAVLEVWPESDYRPWRREEPTSVDPLPCIDFVDDVPLIRTYLRDTLWKDTDLQPGPELTSILSRHGWPMLRPDLAALFDRTEGRSLGRNVRLLDRLCRAASRLADKAKRSDARDVCRKLAAATVAALVRIDADPRDRPAGRAGPTAARLARLSRTLLLLRADDLLARLVAHVLATPDRYPLQAVQMPALAKLGRWVQKRPKRMMPALSRWVADARRRLESLTAAVPQPPADLRRDALVTCGCADCAQLNRFLADPSQRQHDFKMAQARRDHLENQMQTFRCDVDRRTDRKPRPQVLICTKNTATYHRLLDEYHQNLKHLSTLRSIAPQR